MLVASDSSVWLDPMLACQHANMPKHVSMPTSQQGNMQSSRFNVNTLLTRSMLTPLQIGVHTCEHPPKMVFTQCVNTAPKDCWHTCFLAFFKKDAWKIRQKVLQNTLQMLQIRLDAVNQPHFLQIYCFAVEKWVILRVITWKCSKILLKHPSFGMFTHCQCVNTLRLGCSHTVC